MTNEAGEGGREVFGTNMVKNQVSLLLNIQIFRPGIQPVAELGALNNI